MERVNNQNIIMSAEECLDLMSKGSLFCARGTIIKVVSGCMAYSDLGIRQVCISCYHMMYLFFEWSHTLSNKPWSISCHVFWVNFCHHTKYYIHLFFHCLYNDQYTSTRNSFSTKCSKMLVFRYICILWILVCQSEPYFNFTEATVAGRHVTLLEKIVLTMSKPVVSISYMPHAKQRGCGFQL